MDEFEAHRGLMFSIAYRMLGSAMEAEDIVQEAFLRYQRMAPGSIESPKAFLSTVVTRLCINQLESARAKRETYVGPWLPEPLLTDGETPLSPSASISRDESISMAFLVLLESLTPPERAVFLLREVFDYDYAEIARILEREEVACRQLFSRAQKHIADHRPRFRPSPEAHRQMLERFIAAVDAGDMEGLTGMLAENVALWTDGGGKVRGAATRVVFGRERVAQFVLASTRLLASTGMVTGAYVAYRVEVNGELAVLLRANGEPFLLIMIDLDADGIRGVRVLGNRDKLRQL